MIRRGGWCWTIMVAILGASGCAQGRFGARALPDSVATVAAEPPQPPLLRTLPAVPVIGFTGPGDRPFEVASRTSGSDALLHRQIGMRNFALPLRLSATSLRQYPCATCHQGAALTPQRGDSGHNNVRIRLLHPKYNAGACATCHVTGAVERLVLPGGASTTLDHAYRLCAQCHFAQANAWAAGAHGKRLVAWGGRRVVMNCTDCHDPHRPGVEPRLPFPGPRIRRSPERGAR